MFEPVYTTRFEKDLKKSLKRGKDPEKIKGIIELILAGKTLPVRCNDHWLVGNYVNRRECHIEPDWLLIYFPGKKEIVFERTGTHSDLFKN